MLAVADGRHRLFDLRQRQASLFEVAQELGHERLGLAVSAPSVVAHMIEEIRFAVGNVRRSQQTAQMIAVCLEFSMIASGRRTGRRR